MTSDRPMKHVPRAIHTVAAVLVAAAFGTGLWACGEQGDYCDLMETSHVFDKNEIWICSSAAGRENVGDFGPASDPGQNRLSDCVADPSVLSLTSNEAQLPVYTRRRLLSGEVSGAVPLKSIAPWMPEVTASGDVTGEATGSIAYGDKPHWVEYTTLAALSPAKLKPACRKILCSPDTVIIRETLVATPKISLTIADSGGAGLDVALAPGEGWEMKANAGGQTTNTRTWSLDATAPVTLAYSLQPAAQVLGPQFACRCRADLPQRAWHPQWLVRQATAGYSPTQGPCLQGDKQAYEIEAKPIDPGEVKSWAKVDEKVFIRQGSIVCDDSRVHYNSDDRYLSLEMWDGSLVKVRANDEDIEVLKAPPADAPCP